MHEDSLTTRAEFVKVGQATWDIGLNSLKSGNISLLLHNGDILITRTGRSMRGLDAVRDLISIGREETKRGDASCEFYVHRGIYGAAGDSRRGAIVHCHGPCTIAATGVWDDHIPPSFNEAENTVSRERILSIILEVSFIKIRNPDRLIFVIVSKIFRITPYSQAFSLLFGKITQPA